MLGPVGASVVSTTTISPDEFIRRKCPSFLTLNNGFGGSRNASKESETIQNPSKESELPTYEATSLLITPSEEPSSDLGSNGR